MKVIVDCRSITPDRWGGIDTFANAVSGAVAQRGVSVIIDTAAPNRQWYDAFFAEASRVSTVSDPIQGVFASARASGSLIQAPVRLLARGLARLGVNPYGRRRRWAAQASADAVFYPFHKDWPQHEHLPMVTTVHAVLPEYGPAEMEVIAEHVRRAKAVVVSWPEPYEDMLRRFPEVENRLFMIPFTTKSNIDVTPATDVPGVDLQQPYLFFPAVINWRKNHESLIRAYAVAREQGIGLPKVVFSGGGDAALRQELVQLCDQLGVADRFICLGYVSRAAISALYRNCLGTVAPTLWEAGMATIQEGGYYGKPAACSDIAPARAHARMLDMKVCFFDPNDPAHIAAQLAEFVANIDVYRESAVAASARIQAFDEAHLGRCYTDVLAFAAGLAPKPDWQPFLDPIQQR